MTIEDLTIIQQREQERRALLDAKRLEFQIRPHPATQRMIQMLERQVPRVLVMPGGECFAVPDLSICSTGKIIVGYFDVEVL